MMIIPRQRTVKPAYTPLVTRQAIIQVVIHQRASMHEAPLLRLLYHTALFATDLQST